MHTGIQVYQDLEALSEAAARIFVKEAMGAVANRGRFSVALAGGATPRRSYELLAEPRFRDQVSWFHVFVFWGDERAVAPGDARSNYHLASEAFLRRVPIPPENLHPIPAFPASTLGAQTYEAELKTFFQHEDPCFDLVFLGLGADGHTASLFPETTVLAERQRWVVAVAPPYQELVRVTLTPVVLNQAALVTFLVSGADKAGILKEVLEGPRDPRRLPAQLIRPSWGRLYWLVDREAAGLLNLG